VIISSPWTINRRSPQAQGLIGYWPLVEGAGSRVMDVAGNNHGTVVGSLDWAGTPFGNALNFTGSASNYIDVGTAGVTAPSRLTVSVRVYPTRLIFGEVYALLSNRTAGNAGFTITLTNASGAAPNIYAGIAFTIQGVAIYSTTAVHVKLNEPSGVAVVYAGSSVSFYLNGALLETKSAGAMTTGTNLLFGRIGNSTVGPFYGSMSDVRIYNRTLTTSEVADIHVDPDGLHRHLPVPPRRRPQPIINTFGGL
jgi:hypothetical protein